MTAASPLDVKPSALSDLLSQVMNIFDEDMSDARVENLKHNMRANPMRFALQDVLCGVKEKVKLSNKMQKDESDTKEETERLDKMLIAKGVIGPDISHELASEVVGCEQEEYRQHILQTRKRYQNIMSEANEKHAYWLSNVKSILGSQSEFRPITHEDIENTTHLLVTSKFEKIPMKLKQHTCEAIVNLQKRFCDARRKRRNFPKGSTEILNEYFRAHINHPYPSEDVKQALALRCNMTIAQVSNWFGNKRIRYKKTAAKEKENSEMDARKRGIPAAMPNPPFLMPNGFPPMMNPYQMMMQGAQQFPMTMPPINFPVYNPEMMAQYQQTVQNASQPQ